LSNKSPIHFAGESGKGNRFLNAKKNVQNDIDRHGPRLMPNNCKNLNRPNFSLPSTFKVLKFFDADPGSGMEKFGSGINIGSATDFPQGFALTGGFVVEYVAGFCCFVIG
jgi:hypothetical protein